MRVTNSGLTLARTCFASSQRKPRLTGPQEMAISMRVEAAVNALGKVLFAERPGLRALINWGSSLRGDNLLDRVRLKKKQEDLTAGEQGQQEKDFQKTIVSLAGHYRRTKRPGNVPAAGRARRQPLKLVEALNLNNSAVYELAESVAKNQRVSEENPRYLAAVERCLKEVGHERNKLVEPNQGLVVKSAWRYFGRGLDLLELIQEGNIGLMKAGLTFDYRRGCRFSTYAVSWIEQSIRRAVHNKVRPMRYPVNVEDKMSRALAIERRMENVGLGPAAIEAAVLRETGFPLEKVRFLLVRGQMTSLEQRVNNGPPLVDRLCSPGAVGPEQSFSMVELREMISKSLNVLNPMQRRVIALRFGIDGEPREHTLREAGEHLSLSRERVRQLQTQALCILRGHLGNAPAPFLE